MGSCGTMNKTALVDFVENESEITVRYRAFTISDRTKLAPLSLSLSLTHTHTHTHTSVRIFILQPISQLLVLQTVKFLRMKCIS